MAAPSALDFITVKGFKSISYLRCDLRQINVLIGANGSGKSNFLSVFEFLRETGKGPAELRQYVGRAGGAEQLLHFGSKVSKEIEIDISIGGGSYQYGVVLKPTYDDNLYSTRQKFKDAQADPLATPQDSGSEATINDADYESFGVHRARPESWRIYHLNDTSPSAPIRKTSKLNDNAFLRPDGSNLSAFLYLLQQKHPESYRLIRGTVGQVAPFFDDFILKPDLLNEETIRLTWKHKNSDQYFGASAMSDGSLRFVVLATLLLQPDRFLPSVILIDEPELALHPYAITLLGSLVKQASVKSQVILSTQSSLLLGHFEPEDVFVAERSQGGMQLTRLEPSRLEAWLEDYSLGQLWEKNELGGRPGPE
jgi:predicted ATPase